MSGSTAFSPNRLRPATIASASATLAPRAKPIAIRSSEISIACWSVP
jgi:hypothetical protein